MNQSSTYQPRRTHRKRHSAIRLSSDTTATLPVYTSPIWQRPRELPEDSDRPPDYPSSAEDADEESDPDNEVQVVYVPPLSPPPLASPRRIRRYPGAAARRRLTGSTSDLDSLLQRSVHALEMSNALLQSSMSTQSSLTALLATDNVADLSLDRSARSISTSIRGRGNIHENWMDDLDEISKGVNGLFGEDAAVRIASSSAESSVSRSLPTSSMPSMAQRHWRRPSLNFHKAATTDSAPHLHLSSEVDRTELIAQAPRALTLYIASTDDPDSIVLPSTLGLRTSASSHSSDWRSPESLPPSTMPYSGLKNASASLPVLTDRPSDPSTPAYNLLSSFMTQQTPPSSFQTPKSSPFSFRRRRGSGSTTSTSTERGICFSNSPTKRMTQASPDSFRIERRGSGSRSRSLTPKRLASPNPAPRPMTPPIEELSASSSSSASSDHPHAYRTVQSLRKILDEQPVIDDKKSDSAIPERLKAPAFLPRSPPPAASFGTSTATASISRLLTKSIHHSSTRPPSPPRQSSMKRSSAPVTPLPMTPSSSTSTIPELFGAGMARMMGSANSSGHSTPKRISFAQLPEPYASSRPEGSARFRAKQSRSRSKGKGKGKAKSQVDKDREESGSWWNWWLLGASGANNGNLSAQRHEERMEDRAARSLGGRPGFGGLDEWAV